MLRKVWTNPDFYLISLRNIRIFLSCNNQHFHIDYNGKTDTYFIPLFDLNATNGTEYVKFNNIKLNLHYFEDLKKLVKNI
jgi:hypothetical protein